MLGPHTLTIVSQGWDGSTRDRHNNPVASELDTFDIVGAFVQQRDSDETQPAQETTVTEWVAIAPPPTAPDTVKAIDLIRITATTVGVEPDPGETFATFEIVGDPDHAHHFDGSTHHLELILRRVQL